MCYFPSVGMTHSPHKAKHMHTIFCKSRYETETNWQRCVNEQGYELYYNAHLTFSPYEIHVGSSQDEPSSKLSKHNKKKKKSKREKESGAAGKGLINRLSITSLFSSVSGSMAKLQVYSYLWGLPCLTWQGKAGAVNSSGCYEPLISLANEACNLAKPRALWTADTIQTTNRKNANALMNLEGKGGKKKRK